ncbi:hypothetical protein FORC46_p0056 (plasmid) [Campylobacter jejuni]|nr:hypothetical protein FORC46_p0056 [Campylobacter jejuni]
MYLWLSCQSTPYPLSFISRIKVSRLVAVSLQSSTARANILHIAFDLSLLCLFSKAGRCLCSMPPFLPGLLQQMSFLSPAHASPVPSSARCTVPLSL